MEGSGLRDALKGVRVGKPRLVKGMAVIPLSGNRKSRINIAPPLKDLAV